MGETNLRILLSTPGIHQIQMNGSDLHHIRLATPVGVSSARIVVDTVEGWLTKPTYIPKKGELVIYSDRNVVGDIPYPGIKIGDGGAYVVDLPFVGDDVVSDILRAIEDHINNTSIHVTEEEKNFWGAKLNCEVSDELLVFNRL